MMETSSLFSTPIDILYDMFSWILHVTKCLLCRNYFLATPLLLFSARQHICYSALYAIARPSVCPSVCPSVPLSDTRVDQSKTVEVRITQPSPQSSPMTSFLTRNGTLKFQREDRERGRRIRQGYEKYAIFSQ